jgi:hypothetical protein
MALAALMFAGFSFVTVELAPVGLLSTISADLRLSLSAVGLLVTVYGLTVAVSSIPLTRLMGAVPRRYLLSGLLVVFVAATGLSVAGPSYWALTAGRVATALSQAVFWSVAAPAAVALFSPGGSRARPRLPRRYREQDRAKGRALMAKLIDTVSHCVPKALTEIITLGRTLKKRVADVLAYFDRPGTSNGPTDAINGRLEHLRGSALGFRNLSNYIARSLLETGGFRPQLHPRL